MCRYLCPSSVLSAEFEYPATLSHTVCTISISRRQGMRLTIFICLLCHRYPWSYSTPLRMGGQWGHRRLYFCKVFSIPFLISSPYTCILFTSINVKSNCYPIRPITSKFPPMMWWEHRRGYQQVNSAYSPFPGVWQCGDGKQNLVEKSYLYHPQSRWVFASASLEKVVTALHFLSNSHHKFLGD